MSARATWLQLQRGYIGIMEKKMEPIGIMGFRKGLYWGYTGIMEKTIKLNFLVMLMRPGWSQLLWAFRHPF